MAGDELAKATGMGVTRYVPTLTSDIVKKYICDKANDQEIYFFMELCKSQELNPFMKEAFLIKYGSEPASMVVAYQVFIKRAEKNPTYNGFKAGIIVLDGDKKITYREGAFYLETEQILGGWCEVYRRDRSTPYRIEVAFNEYVGRKGDGTINKQWATKPGTMIRKVPIAQAHRDAFPDELGRLYLPEEFAADEDALPAYEMGKAPVIPVPEGMQGFRAPTQTQPATQKPAQSAAQSAGNGAPAGAAAAQSAAGTETGELATEPQVKKIAICLKELGLTTDDEKHEYASVILAKAENIASIKDLTKREASTLIEALVKNIAAAGAKK
ncbi:phage recombination protein Bet [Patescibacteria group bacterium]|jgi:phage recombination protein Bet|nr:phage recombination protein Bet [Patescibacteria group bacterium]